MSRIIRPTSARLAHGLISDVATETFETKHLLLELKPGGLIDCIDAVFGSAGLRHGPGWYLTVTVINCVCLGPSGGPIQHQGEHSEIYQEYSFIFQSPYELFTHFQSLSLVTVLSQVCF